MKRSHITAGLLGAVLSVGLLIAPAAADTTSGGGTPDPSATATQTPPSAPTGSERVADSPEAPKASTDGGEKTPGGVAGDPAEPGGGEAGATEDPEVGPSADPGETPPGDPAEPTDPADPTDPAAEDPASGAAGAVVAGDPGMTSKNKQYSKEASVVSIHREGCVLTFEDDGVQVGTVEVGGAAGEVVTATYTMGANVGTEAWGYDFLLKSGEAKVQYIDWNFEGSEMVMTQCAAAAASQAPVATVASSKPAPALARTGPAVGLGVLIVLVLVGGGIALRRFRHKS